MKNNNTTKNKIINITIITTLILILLLSVPTMFSLNKNFYYKETQKTNAHLFLDNQENLYENVHEYLKGKQPLSQEFNENEKEHMEDVKKLFFIINTATMLAILLIIVLFIIQIKTNKKQKNKNKIWEDINKKIKTSATITVIIQITLILLMLIFFQQVFTIFHIIFFPQGNWLFPIDGLIITLFPQTFFYNMAKKIIIITLIMNLIILATTIVVELKIKKNKEKNRNKIKKKLVNHS